MAGANLAHNVIVLNIAASIHRNPAGCLVVASEMRVRVEHATTWVYPDVAGLRQARTSGHQATDTAESRSAG